MNWFLWFITITNILAAMVYFYYALNKKTFVFENKSPIGMVVWSVVGTIILFWTTGPLNIFGLLYVAYTASSTVFFFSQAHRKLNFNPWICALFGLICSMWPVIILTVGLGA